MKIVCKNCGWSWNRNDGGVNPCKCHKCGYNNKDMYGKKIVGLGSVSKNKFKVGDFFINEKYGTDIKLLKKYGKGMWVVRVIDGNRIVGEKVMFDRELKKLKRR